VVFGFAVVDFAVVDFDVLDFVAADFASGFDAVDFEVEDFAEDAVDRFRADERFASSPIGSALPTALTAPLATSPTVPATLPAVFPAVRPTCFTILAGSGIGCPPFVRLVGRRSSVRSARFMPPCCSEPFGCPKGR
jgi:hypothetical protein